MTNDESRLRLADYLSHILEAAWPAREYVENTVKADFLNDRRTQQAVVLNLITIGEAASRIVSDCGDFAATHSEIPWAQMRGMRNRMTHGYFDIGLVERSPQMGSRRGYGRQCSRILIDSC